MQNLQFDSAMTTQIFPFSKIYLKPTKAQDYYKGLCIENAKAYISKEEEVAISHERTFTSNGEFHFFIMLQSKERNSLRIMFDRTFAVKITRSGKVYSRPLMGSYKFVKNQNCFFI